MKLLHKLYHWAVVKRYVHIGRCWGDYESYCPAFGMPRNIYDRALARWEKRYTDLGYKAIPTDRWIAFGGYGRRITDILCKKDEVK